MIIDNISDNKLDNYLSSYKVTMDDWQFAPSTNSILITVVIILVVIGIILLIAALISSSQNNTSNNAPLDDEDDDDVEFDDEDDEGEVIEHPPRRVNNPINDRPVQQHVDKPKQLAIPSPHSEKVTINNPPTETLSFKPTVVSKPVVERGIIGEALDAELASVEDFHSPDTCNSGTTDSSLDLSSIPESSEPESSSCLISSSDILILSEEDDVEPSTDLTPKISDISDEPQPSSEPQVSDLTSSQLKEVLDDPTIDDTSDSLASVEDNAVSPSITPQPKVPRPQVPQMKVTRPKVPMPAKISPYNPVAPAVNRAGDETSGLTVEASMTNPASLSSDFSDPTEKSERKPAKPKNRALTGVAALARYNGKNRNIF